MAKRIHYGSLGNKWQMWIDVRLTGLPINHPFGVGEEQKKKGTMIRKVI